MRVAPGESTTRLTEQFPGQPARPDDGTRTPKLEGVRTRPRGKPAWHSIVRCFYDLGSRPRARCESASSHTRGRVCSPLRRNTDETKGGSGGSIFHTRKSVFENSGGPPRGGHAACKIWPKSQSAVGPEAVVVTFAGEGIRLALQLALRREDQAVGGTRSGAEGDVGGVRKLRIQTAGCFGSTIPQRPTADLFANTINSPPPPAGRFFWPMYIQSSSASTHVTCPGLAAARTLPATSASTQFSTALWLTPTNRSVARSPRPRGSAPGPTPAWPAPPCDDPIPRWSSRNPGTASVAAHADCTRSSPPFRFRNVGISCHHHPGV